MKLNPLFCIRGCGYLHDVIKPNDEMLARIKMLTQIDASTFRKDDVWVEAEISDDHLKTQFARLAWTVQKGYNVLIVFTAEYVAFLNAMSGQTPTDPNHIISMKVKLHRLEECLVDGQPIEASKPLLKAVA